MGQEASPCSSVSALLVAAFMFFSGALPAIAMEFVLIRGSTFTMGSPEGEVDHEIDETEHQVKVSDFYIAKYW